MDLEPRLEPVRRGIAGGAFGVLSIALLAASLRWAHHWGPMAVTIVAAWSITTIAAPAFSIWSLCTSSASRRLAKLGVSLTLVTLAALALGGLLLAAGINAAGACGGG